MAHQQPSGAALLDRVHAVARGGLGDLAEQRLRVAQQQAHCGRTVLEHLLELRGTDPSCLPGYLAKAHGRNRVAAKYERKPSHPFRADGRELYREPVCSGGKSARMRLRLIG